MPRVMRTMPSSSTASSSPGSPTSRSPSHRRHWRAACERCWTQEAVPSRPMARILVMDDDGVIRAAVRRILESAGHEVLEAADGAAGLRLHREQGADLVVVDIFMPGRDGVEVIRALRQEAPLAKVVAISGGGRHRNV